MRTILKAGAIILASGQSFTTQSPTTTTGKYEATVTATKNKTPDNYVLKSSGN